MMYRASVIKIDRSPRRARNDVAVLPSIRSSASTSGRGQPVRTHISDEFFVTLGWLSAGWNCIESSQRRLATMRSVLVNFE